MNLRRVLLGVLCCVALGCGETRPASVPLGGPCLRDTDCMAPFACRDSLCQVPAERLCAPGKSRCNGDSVEKCSDLGDAWVKEKDCSIACIPGDAPDCAPPACTPNERKCDGQFVEQCLDTGAAWVTIQTCPTSCTDTSGTVECSTPLCTPFATRCNAAERGKIETCNSRGTIWEPAVSCTQAGGLEQVCAQDRCQTKVCEPNAQRCRGVVKETCNADGTGYASQEVCRYGCDWDEEDKTATCPASICAPGSTRCTPNRMTVEVCNSRGTAWEANNERPLNGEVRCVGGKYLPKLCTAGQERCAGTSRERCDATETAWETIEACTFGCTPTAAGTSCSAAACAAGEARCDDKNLLVCAPDRASFTLSRYCPNGCNANTATTPPSAACKPVKCLPLSRQCGSETATGRSFVELCRADGTDWERIETCPGACTGNGLCEVTADTCTIGEVHCKGAEVEECVADGNATKWSFVERCLGRCGGGACLDGGAATTFALQAVLPAEDPTLSCDGATRVLLHSDVIRGAGGEAVPDGSMVTFAHDGAGALLASADADPAAAGLQRPTLHGRATVLVKAPAAADCAAPRKLKVTGSLGGRAVGSTTVDFAAPIAGAVKRVLVSDDFSTTDIGDLVQTTATWELSVGALTANPVFDPGRGTDGDLVVTGTTNLANGYARSWDVLSFGTSDVRVATVLPTLSPGDEVLLVTLVSDTASAIGAYETKTVASVATGRVVFSEPIRTVFSTRGNADLTGHRVVMQRIPHLRNVTVEASGILTTNAWSAAANGGTGILAMRVSDTLRVLGKVDVNNLGRPGGSSVPTFVPTEAINRIAPGSNIGGSAGGGVIWVNARKLLFKTTAGAVAPSTAQMTARGNGYGGTIWAAAGSHEYGTAVTRHDVNGSSAGRARLDFARLDNQTNPATPAFYLGLRGGYALQTRRIFEETDATLDIYRATLLGVLAGTSTTELLSPTIDNGGLATLLPSVSLRVSADDGSTYGIIDGGSVTFNTNGTSPSFGKRFRARGTLSTDDSKPLRLRGLVFQLDIQ